MRKLILVLGFLLSVIPVKANEIYIAQSGSGDGLSCSTPKAYTFFNSGSNWGTKTGQITAGTTIHLCGTISAALAAPTSSGTGTITIKFESGAKLSQAAGQNFIVLLNSQNSWLIDGGFPCGPSPSGEVACNGVIENTANGTDLASQVTPVKAFDLGGTTGAIEIRGLEVQNLYVHTPQVPLTNISSNGTNQVTLTCSGPCGKVVGESGLSVSDSNVAAYNASKTLQVVSVSGSTIVLKYPATISAASANTGNLVDGIVPNTDIMGVHDNPVMANVSVHDCIFHDMSWALDFTPATGSNGAVIDLYNLDVHNVDHGPTLGGTNTNGSVVFKFHDSHFHDPTNWNTGTLDYYHHDGYHFFNSQTQAAAVYVYNNLFDGPLTGNMTTFMFNQQSLSNSFVFNNVAICNFSAGCTDSPNQLHEGGGGPNQLFVNNTLIQTGQSRLTPPFNQSNGGCIQQFVTGTNTSGNNTMMNNIATSCTVMVTTNGVIFASNGGTSGLDYNLYANRIADGNPAFNWNNGSTETNDFATWQSVSGEGTHSSFISSANLDANGAPVAGSAAIGAGSNLSALCIGNLTPLCSDTSAGNSRTPVARPGNGGGNWDIGAYKYIAAHPISLVQVRTHTYENNTTIGIPVTETAGNLLVAATGYLANVTASVTDSIGNTWHPLLAQGNANSGCGGSGANFSGMQLWYAENIKGGSNTVTLQLSAQTFLWIVVAEYSGIKTSGSLLASSGSISTTVVSSISTGNLNATGPNNLIVAAFTDTDQHPNNMSAGPGGYVDEADGGIGAMFENLVSAAPGTYNPSAIYNNPADSCGAAVGAAFSSQ